VLSFPPSSCSLHFTTRRNINYNKWALPLVS
jgi:hypothetical protein